MDKTFWTLSIWSGVYIVQCLDIHYVYLAVYLLCYIYKFSYFLLFLLWYIWTLKGRFHQICTFYIWLFHRQGDYFCAFCKHFARLKLAITLDFELKMKREKKILPILIMDIGGTFYELPTIICVEAVICIFDWGVIPCLIAHPSCSKYPNISSKHRGKIHKAYLFLEFF